MAAKQLFSCCYHVRYSFRRRCGLSACHDKICLANGCMQAEVLPEPTAPKIATPVYSPRSGMVSQEGLKISRASTG